MDPLHLQAPVSSSEAKRSPRVTPPGCHRVDSKAAAGGAENAEEGTCRPEATSDSDAQRCDAGAGRNDFPCSTLGCDHGRGGTHPSGESGFLEDGRGPPDKSQGSRDHPEREGTRWSLAAEPQARARRRRRAARGLWSPTHAPPRKLGLGGAQSPCLGGSYSER